MSERLMINPYSLSEIALSIVPVEGQFWLSDLSSKKSLNRNLRCLQWERRYVRTFNLGIIQCCARLNTIFSGIKHYSALDCSQLNINYDKNGTLEYNPARSRLCPGLKGRGLWGRSMLSPVRRLIATARASVLNPDPEDDGECHPFDDYVLDQVGQYEAMLYHDLESQEEETDEEDESDTRTEVPPTPTISHSEEATDEQYSTDSSTDSVVTIRPGMIVQTYHHLPMNTMPEGSWDESTDGESFVYGINSVGSW
ncbi:hypothetical protein EDC01DRAFT_636143 [Geopyxis carbonaria]|nr:hypothetical protein EDC01DRAFT_636143 [Geopyxis carbonaria]